MPFLLVGPLTPDIRAQKDLRRFAALPPAFSLLGFFVTGLFKFAPVLRLASARLLRLSRLYGRVSFVVAMKRLRFRLEKLKTNLSRIQNHRTHTPPCAA